MRIKFQVLGENGWKTAYVLPDKLMANITLMRYFGITFRVVQ
jgi:hypothetical protein